MLQEIQEIVEQQRECLPALINKIPLLFDILGDAANAASDNLLTTFQGNQRNIPENYSPSTSTCPKMRTWIEPAVGLLVGYSLSVASDTIAASIRLHYLVKNSDGNKDNVTFEQVEEHGPQ